MADKLHTFVFDDESEATVRLSPLPMADYFGLLEAWDKAETAEEILSVMSRFGDLALVSWSFPEPATSEGMLRRDFQFAAALIKAWAAEVRGVPRPLPRASSDGEPSEAPTA